MNKILLALSVVSLGGLAQASAPSAGEAAAQRGGPTRLERMDYLAARRIILGYGWQPVIGRCLEGWHYNSECAVFPEIGTVPASGRPIVA